MTTNTRNKPNNSRRRLMKDAQMLLSSAQTLYWHELEKPAEERDEALMSECLRTIEESSAIIFAERKHNQFYVSRAVRFAAAALAALFVVSAAAFGVAKAFGVDMWELIFRRTETGIEIQGKSNEDADNPDGVDFDAIEEYDNVKVASVREAIEKLHINPLNLDLTKYGYMIDNIYITKNDVCLEYFAEYLTDGGYADVTVQVYNGGTGAAYVTELVGGLDAKTREINGVTIYFAGDGIDSFLCFACGEYVYQLNSNAGAEVISGYIDEAISAYH